MMGYDLDNDRVEELRELPIIKIFAIDCEYDYHKKRYEDE